MNGNREQILRNIRAGLSQAVLPAVQSQRPELALPRSAADRETFVAELTRVAGRVIRARTAAAAAAAVGDLFVQRGWQEALAWDWPDIGCDGLAAALRAAGVQVYTNDHHPRELAGVPVGLTGAEAGIAETGTLVLDKRPRRPALASLLPPVHVALLRADRIVPDLPTYLAGPAGSPDRLSASSQLIFITGPSRTGDIELTLTLGVHGPRELIVVLWGEDQASPDSVV